MTGRFPISWWEYWCPKCGAQVASGFADSKCPMKDCGAEMELIHGPEPTPAQIDEVILGFDLLLAGQPRRAPNDAGTMFLNEDGSETFIGDNWVEGTA